MQLHIIMYSELKPYGGGRETWLQYFLPSIRDKFEKIYVYALKTDSTSKNILDVLEIESEAIYTHRISVKLFVATTKKALEKKLKCNDVCVMVGSVVEGALSKWIKSHYKTIKRLIWVRSIAAREIANRHIKIVYPLVSALEKRNLNSADAVITNGNDTFEYYRNYWLKNKNKRLHCIPNAVDTNKYIYKKKWNDAIPLRCVFLGRFEPIKGGKILLQVIEQFNNRYSEYEKDIEFIIWGEGSLSERNYPNNVFYMGKAERNQVPKILEGAHVEFFLTDVDENGVGGLSHSLLEGLASGCICMCTDVSANRQVISNENGILISQQNIDKIVDELVKILLICKNNEGERYSDISENARKTSEKYSVENHISKFMDVIAQ